MTTSDLDALAPEPFCYVTTVGRISGRPHTIEIWFAMFESVLYILSGGGRRSDWVKNAIRDPAVSVRIGSTTVTGTARVVTGDAEDAQARRLLLDKYSPTYAGDLSDWGRAALPIAVDFKGSQSG